MQVSVACRDLLKQMLTAEPSKRISIGGIMNHPWFLKDLPAGTHEMNARLQATDNVRSVHNQNVPTASSMPPRCAASVSPALLGLTCLQGSPVPLIQTLCCRSCSIQPAQRNWLCSGALLH